jgi:hypothetical protein
MISQSSKKKGHLQIFLAMTETHIGKGVLASGKAAKKLEELAGR